MRVPRLLPIFLCTVQTVYLFAQDPVRPPLLTLTSAVEATLKNNPTLLIQDESIVLAYGLLQVEAGNFDWALYSDLSYSSTDSPVTEDVRASTAKTRDGITLTEYQIGFRKTFRSGVILNPLFKYQQTVDHTFDLDNINKSSADIVLTIPLLKNRGRSTVAAAEESARANLDAARLTRRHAADKTILSTAQAFWGYLAAAQQLEILKDAEVRAKQLVADVKRLIEGDQRPASDLDQLIADLADKTGTRISGEQSLVATRQALGLAMGVEASKVMNLAAPAGGFPGISSEINISDIAPDDNLPAAMKNRADLLASMKQVRAAEVLYESARLQKRHKFDFLLSTGYRETESGNNTPLYADTGEYTAVGILKYVYPIGNRTYNGLCVKALANYRQAQIQHNDLIRKIYSSIHVAADALRRSILRLEKAKESVAYYGKAVENETKKLHMGMSTVVDIVTVENLWRNAMLSEVSSRKDYADAIVGLRFETGSLLTTDRQAATTVEENMLIEVPHH